VNRGLAGGGHFENNFPSLIGATEVARPLQINAEISSIAGSRTR
jgi:hypothetical protein